ncbi:MAG: LysM peptidoglycan-binding domain-containing protein [Oscillospiraceae bacterium]|nr:LysM peptidoglycan-binding domain-containing protein [Oscillospiraceae bacterium]MDD4369170.1 LysM peptidoglycan-binding domain-containing protein [Oscillospiraceae bacterium]
MSILFISHPLAAMSPLSQNAMVADSLNNTLSDNLVTEPSSLNRSSQTAAESATDQTATADLSLAELKQQAQLALNHKAYRSDKLSPWDHLSDRVVEYTVKSGDSWSAIARQYNVDYRVLAAYNGLCREDEIYAEEILSIPPQSLTEAETTDLLEQEALRYSQYQQAEADAAAQAAAQAAVSSGVAAASSSGNDGPVLSVDDSTLNLFLGVVAAEAGASWGYDGCLMLAQTIVNRALSGSYGSLYGVLTASGQYDVYSSGAWQTATPTATQRQAALDALNGKTILGRDVYYFCTTSAYNSSSWFQSLDHRATYENTMFFAA